MCADCASALALARVRLSALAVAAVMAACGPSAERPATEAVPRSRHVVGAMAEQLITLRGQITDAQWDDMMTTMYPQPHP